MNLFLVRHGEILSNLRKVYAGRSSEPLTERGGQQAYETAKKLGSMNIHALYTSPMKRAIETAEIIGSVIGKEYKIMDELREMKLGQWEGMSESEIAQLYPKKWELWLTRPAELILPDRETLDEILRRSLNGIKKIIDNHLGQNIVIVTHVAIIRVLLLWHKKMDLSLYKTVNIPNGRIFKLEISDGRI